jgi:hypothetical protein
VVVYLDDKMLNWDVFADIPSIAPRIRTVLTPTLALVAPTDLDALRAELAERGVALQAGVVPAEALAAEPDDLGLLGPSEKIRTMLSRLLGGPLADSLELAGEESPWPARRR